MAPIGLAIGLHIQTHLNETQLSWTQKATS